MKRLLEGHCPALEDVYERIDKAAHVEFPVLIVGETGTGKELAASEIHARSGRAKASCVTVNVGAFSRELVYSHLFGHVRGAFTGATHSNDGRFKEAHGGTLFLDEINSADERVQVALLRVLEGGGYRPLGAQHDENSDARIIAAMNVPALEAVESGDMREDLMYRLNVITIELPPLRDHLHDIPLLTRHIMDLANESLGTAVSDVNPDVYKVLQAYSWPGNVRELRNVVIEAAVMADGAPIEVKHLPSRLVSGNGVKKSPDYLGMPMGATLNNVTLEYIHQTLRYCGNNKTKAADTLGISRRTLYAKLRES